MRKSFSLLAVLLLTALLVGMRPAAAAQLQVLLPLGRTSYQTNELIDISVVRSDAQALPAGVLTMTAASADGSQMTFTFPAQAVPVANGSARATENLHLNGWLLKPGAYTVTVNADGAAATTNFTVYSHVRQSTYKTIHWGGPNGDAMVPEGVDGMGFNIIMNGDVTKQEQSIRAGVDIMGNCLMGGGHQHDLKLYNDWSDPYVYLGAVQRGVDRAFAFRTMPNAIGAHLHDEPGLTWAEHPHLKGPDGKPLMTDHDVPPQREAYKRAFGEEAIWVDQYDPKDPQKLAQWKKINDFKLGMMDAFWKSSEQIFSRFKPGYLAVTQSQYGWSALYDGYYFNVARSMPVVSGHGGYNDFGPRNFNPSYFLEMALPRQLDKPTWYLPEWYDGMSSEAFREEHNMSFITGIQGMSTPPGMNVKSKCAPGITECNKLYARLGTIFTKPAYTGQDVALLYSKSNLYYDREHSVFGYDMIVYMATKLAQYPMQVVLDEDVIDGTLANNHKALILAGITYLDPEVITGLETFIKNGGVVLEFADSTVQVAGATKINVKTTALYDAAQAALKNMPEGDAKKEASAKANSFRACMEYAEPTAKALKAALMQKGIMPAFTSDVESIAAGKQVRGDIEYFFAVNFTPVDGYNLPGGYGEPVAAKATLAIQDNGCPIYNAIDGGAASFAKKGQSMQATLQFAPGQMLAFARTARPIGGVTVSAPVINRDFTRDAEPQRIEFSATLLDNKKDVLAGTAPLQITVTDPQGAVRYDLYRATDNGVCMMSLPLAANDAVGKWTVTVKELLSNTQGTATFTYKPMLQCGILAGKTQRATFFQYDKENIYNFFRNNRQITIVVGKSDYNQAAAERLAASLAPYNVKATIITAADANKPRELSAIEAATWCGDQCAGKLNTGRNNPATVVGFDLPGPTVLLGNAQDNPLIAHLSTIGTVGVLPYKVTADFPGRGHGLVAWNVMTLGHDIEAVACVANDADGMNEAAGTLFQLAEGLDTLTPLQLPSSNAITVTAPVVK